MQIDRAPLNPAVVQQAAEWMARLWSDEVSDADRADCAAWCAADQSHERAWQRLQMVGQRLDGLPVGIARGSLQSLPSPGRRRALQLFGMVAVVGGATYLARETDTWRRAASDHSTAVGEIREIALPDGTRLVLDSASAVDVRFDASERRIVLRTGQIFVATAHAADDAPTPLRVQTEQGTVQALGTRFTVRQHAESSQVAVFDGAVELQPRRAIGLVSRLDAGQAASLFDEVVQSITTADFAAAAWVRGQLIAEGMRVADFIAELARYRPGILRCDPAIADLRVSGVFPLRNTDRALENLTLGLPVEIVQRTRYWVSVRAR